MIRRAPATPALALSVLLACSASRDPPLLEPDVPIDGSFVITHVAVVPMDAPRVLEDRTVIVRDGRITGIGPAAELQPDDDLPLLDGRGLFLLPGLIDMHVHIAASDLEAYVHNGVTTVRNMWGYTELAPIIADVDAGRRAGPRILSLTAGFDGSPATWPQTQLSDDVTTIPANLARQVELGFREIKMYQRLSRAAYDTLVALANRQDLSFAGHLPTAVPLRHAIDAGQRSIEHLGGFRTSARLAEDARYAAERGVYVCPTLAVQSILNRGAGDDMRASVTRVLHENGVRLLVGTDAGIDATAPGTSIHDELRRFVDAGLTPYEALRGATTLAAEYLHLTDHIGTVAVGREADLLLVRGDPLRDIAATARIAAVFLDGRRVR